MRDERLWERLLHFLGEMGDASEIAPGRVIVVLEEPGDGPVTVEIVMTPAQLDDMASVAWGDFDSAAQHVQTRLLALQGGERFLVYGSYDLTPSATPELPVDPEEERLTELARQHPERNGRWVVLDREGNVADSFGPSD